MKSSIQKTVRLLLLILALPMMVFGQGPEKLSYQSVLRDSEGNPIMNTAINLGIEIRQGGSEGTLVYTETHAVSTNELGMIQVFIGTGTSTDVFSDIDWSAGPFFLKISVDGTPMGGMEMVSVPYALYANKAGNSFSGNYADLSGKPDLSAYLTTYTETDPLFAASPANGITNALITNWNAAYGWGDHASAGYLTDADNTDSDPQNEIQDLNLSSNTLTITGKTSPTNIDLSPYLDDTNLWTFKGDSLFYLGGNVGIGTIDPRSTLTVEGTTPNDSAIFEVKNSLGRTIFAVYEDGVRVNIYGDGTKGRKGGFAIGGFTDAKGPEKLFDYFSVHPDSIRLNFVSNSNLQKGVKGGFAIGGFSDAKGAVDRFLNITGEDATGEENEFNTTLGYQAGGTAFSTDPARGGSYNVSLGNFAGYKMGSTGTSNVSIGNYAAYNISTGYNNVSIGNYANYFQSGGRYNVFIGDSAGYANSGGYNNVAIGISAYSSTSAGYHNVIIGYRAGANGWNQYNTFIGNQSGENNDGGFSNVFMGDRAGQKNDDGYRNTFLGTWAGKENVGGDNNTMVGNSAGYANTAGSSNTFIGESAGSGGTTGSNNTYIGYGAGKDHYGSSNIFIGSGARSSAAADQDDNYTLMISPFTVTDMEDAFIYGYMSGTKKMIVNGNLGVHGSPATGYELYVYGDAGGSGGWGTISDARLKTNIAPITNPLDKVLQLNGVSFNWKDPGHGTNREIGLIAQEVYKTLPEVVKNNGEFYSVEYATITPLLIEAIKELKAENDELRKRLEKVEELEQLLLQMQSEMAKEHK